MKYIIESLLRRATIFLLLALNQASAEPLKYSFLKKDLVEPEVAEAIFSSSRGYYDTAFNLVISCSTPGSQIIYTDDGSLPSLENGMIGDEGLPCIILVSGTKIIRAFAIKKGFAPSDVDTHSRQLKG